MINLAKMLLSQIELEEQRNVTCKQESLNQATKMKAICHQLSNQLRDKLMHHQFKSEEEEIYFFKYCKPLVLAKLIYYCELFQFYRSGLSTDPKIQKKYINKRLKKIQRFSEEQSSLLYYLQSGKTNHDQDYFLRKNFDPVNIPHPSLWNINSLLATNKDYLVARFMAYKKLRPFFRHHLLNLDQWDLEENAITPTYQSSLKWTASKTALVELIYSLRETKAINNGTIEIKELAQSMEIFFNIQLGEPYRKFNDIKTKRKNQASFLEQLENAFRRLLD